MPFSGINIPTLDNHDTYSSNITTRYFVAYIHQHVGVIRLTLTIEAQSGQYG